MKKIKLDLELIYIIMIICMSDGFFYIFNDKVTLILKNLSYLVSLFMFIIFLPLFIKKSKKMNFKFVLILFIILILLEPLNTNFLYGQPMLDGYTLNLKYLLYFNYLFITYYINKNLNNLNKLENYMIRISLFASLLYIVQFLLLPKIILFGLGYRINYRFGEPRFYICTLLFAMTLIFCIIKLLFDKNNSNKKFVFSITICLNTFVLINICKTRSIMIAIIICLMLLIFIKIFKSNPIKAVLFIIIGSLCIILLLSTESVKNMIDLTTNGDGKSIDIRMNEIKYYFDQVKNNIIFGRGEIHRGLYPDIDGFIYNFYLDDLGFFGVFIKFGLFGLLIMILMFIKEIKILLLNNKKLIILKLNVLFVIIYILMVGILIPYLDQGESIIFICILMSYLDYIKNTRKTLED
ncbi:O-antigen ligase family protein [Clostridium perfringens]|uniref:O-antigen ligase family protein n=1 Tax=Clostridium perfringens TaxID=1502 RepID=UPI0024BC6BB5|nr:O-antigen ligase family protein [Clostridium perfringens]